LYKRETGTLIDKNMNEIIESKNHKTHHFAIGSMKKLLGPISKAIRNFLELSVIYFLRRQDS
jgi:hypothetical protein